MDVAIALLALMFVVFVVLGALAVVKTTRAVKRGVERTVADTRRSVTEASLKVRSAAQPGALGEIASLRLGLRTSIDSARTALTGAAPGDPAVQESLRLLDQLHAYGRALDSELRQLEREPDKARVAERMTDARQRTERIRHSADSLRWAVQDRTRHAQADGLDELQAQIDLEAGALRHWNSQTAGEAEASGASTPSSSAPREINGAQKLTQDAFQTLLSKIEKVRRDPA
ncbi:hypothetical protein SRB5_58330 [Streptomyces sp. RB5]|uniref:Secreted protein n=1 Tax=Streptomyces smaragdinus TaxID=2585196 RepID=A0A7K0CQ98_9ACTN|nr:hypothetical protein [Streptomyces smaragdinus]MQY15645.1 hypothetical protein [Streptomyces smaragdinus]